MSETLLEVEGLNAFYGTAHILHGVSFSMGAEPVALIGRNGMGKTTLNIEPSLSNGRMM